MSPLAASLPIFYMGQINLYTNQNDLLMLQNIAPDTAVTPYDQRNLALYAALLDAEAAGTCWQIVAETLMHINPNDEGAERCWSSHLERARWIVGSGLAQAIEAFGQADA